MFDDLRAAFRSLRTSPTFTAVALAVLALGIGSATAVFSVVDAVVLRGLPFDEHDRLAVVLEHDPTGKEVFGAGLTTPQMYRDWRQMQEAFDGLAAVASSSFRLKSESGEPADARAYRVTWEFFPMLRVAPAPGPAVRRRGRDRGAAPRRHSQHGFWQRRFGGAPDVVGKTIDLNEERSRDHRRDAAAASSTRSAAERPTEIYAPTWFRKEDKRPRRQPELQLDGDRAAQGRRLAATGGRADGPGGGGARPAVSEVEPGPTRPRHSAARASGRRRCAAGC